MSNNSFIAQTIYTLKHIHGVAVVLHQVADEAVNIRTGVRTTSTNAFKIKKGILLPRNQVRTVVNLVGDGGNFQYGGHVDQNERVLLVDMKDYPKGYNFQTTDYAVISHKRYNINKQTIFDNRLAALFTLTETQGEQPSAVYFEIVHHNFRIAQEVGAD